MMESPVYYAEGRRLMKDPIVYIHKGRIGVLGMNVADFNFCVTEADVARVADILNNNAVEEVQK